MIYSSDLEEFHNDRIVMIHWDDICGFSDSWMDKKDVYDLRPHRCITVGKIVELTEEYITIVASWDVEKTIVSDINCIPIGCITFIGFA